MIHDRQRLESAAIAAKLISSESTTWAKAFREAESITGVLPEAEETMTEIRRWYALFAPERHREVLFAKRSAALSLMQRVPELDLRLVGTVLSGAANENSLPELAATALEEKEALIALLNAGFDPEPFDEPYPTQFVRSLKRVKGGRTVSSSLVDAFGETLLIRFVPFGTPLPQPKEPDEYQRAWEAAGNLDRAELERALEDAASSV